MEVEKQGGSSCDSHHQHIYMIEQPHQPSSSGDDDTSHSDRTPSCVGGGGDTSLSNEPKSKKRRKQSNPVKYQSTLNNHVGQENGEPSNDFKYSPLRGNESHASSFTCPHCNVDFHSDTQLTMHVEEEHVQKIVAKQIQQRNVSIGSTSKNDSDPPCGSPSLLKPKWPTNVEVPASLSLPHIPPLVPLSQPSPTVSSSSSKPIGIPLPPLFPGTLPSFLYPHLMSQRHTPPIINGNPNSNPGGVRIFNPEAFCELCSKEFCNKYFLKTHKANMHGVYTNDMGATSPSYGGTFLNTSLSTTVPMPSFLPNSTPSSSMPDHPIPPPQSSHILNKEAFCELCQKEFCNKYFLRKHRQKIHGIFEPISSASTNSSMNNILSFSGDQKTSMHLTSMSYSNPIFTIPSEKTSHEESCSQNRKAENHSVPSLFQYPTSKQSPMSSFNSIPTSISPTYNMNEGKASQHELSQTNGNIPIFTSDKLRQMNAEAYCELCCKTFSNRYFLRTHLINVHGINVPEFSAKEAPPSSIQTQPLQLTTHKSFDGSDLNKGEDMKQSLMSEQMMNKAPTEVTCDICTRPFASNYLLKMHKFYSHNIPYLNDDDYSKSADEINYSNNSNSENMERNESNNNNSNIGVSSEDTASPDLQKLQSMIKELNAVASEASSVAPTSTMCRLCQQECENKYFLRAHMMNEHGMLPNEDGNPLLMNVPSSLPNNSCTSTSVQNIMDANEEAEQRLKLKLSHKFFNNNIFKNNSQDINFTSKSQDIPLALVSSSNSIPLMSASIAPPFPSMMPQAVNSIPISLVSSSNAINPASFDPKLRHNITGRNYCYICNKELCNKYFMKTHMLKMHGINLENQAQEASQISTIGGVTCDICQKELCSKYFLKVHKQNTHGIYEEPLPPKEQTTFGNTHNNNFNNSNNNNNNNNGDKDPHPHGLLAGEVPESNNRYFTHYTEVCPLCDRRFKSIKWLKTHMVNDHNELIKENMSGPLESPPPPSLPPSLPPHLDTALICVLCGQGFAEKVTLQIHLIKDHRTSSEDLDSNSGIKYTPSSSGLVLNDPLPLNGENEEMKHSSNPSSPHSNHAFNGGSNRIYHCSYCIYSTRWLSNLYAHEKRHTGLILEGDKKFACRICHRSYRYNHSLQRHLLSHKIAGLTLRETNLSSVILPQDLSLRSEDASKSLVKVKRYRCSKCNKKYRTREMCLTHIHAYHRGRKGIQVGQHKVFKCHLCGFTTKILNFLRLHIKKNHQEEDEEIENGCINESLSPSKMDSKENSSAVEVFHPHSPPAQTSPHLPMAYAMPQSPPNAGSFIMQPFLIAQPETETPSRSSDTFVPSLVYLPVSHKVSQPVTVAFTLTPA